MANGKFIKDQVYDNVFMVFIDASGHSNVVKNNPKDMSTQAFDLLFEKINSRLQKVVNKKRCEIGVVWSWLGDGGLIVIYDESENVSLNTTIEFALDILKLDLPTTQSEFENEGINGELHIRMAVHKGTIKYTDDGQQGFIHSADINWGAHLEKVTPKDSVSISKEIYSILPNEKKKAFISVGEFEEREIYILSPNIDKKNILLRWRAIQGFEQVENVQCYLERISQKNKAELIDSAQTMVIDFGTTLNTCSSYLFSTERPVPYRDAVCRLLKRGGKFICYMLEPDSNGSRQLVELRNEDTNEKLRISIERFTQFKNKNADFTSEFKVFQFTENPNLAAMIIDPDSENSLCLYSPYLNGVAKGEDSMGRADMPHYLVSKRDHAIYEYIWEYVSAYMEIAKQVL